jgi:predicted O-linked N-acetylglucosamine transferase (SPINDLY family)
VLGAVLVEMQQLTEGERVLRDALGMAPNAPDALFNLSVALRQQGRVEEQVDLLARIPANWGGLPRVSQDLAQAGLFLLMSGRHEGAVRAYRALLALQPGARATSYNLALALTALSRHDEAIVAIAGALAAGHVDAELLGMLVNAKGMACEWRAMDEATEELRRAAREPGTRPVHPHTAQYLAQVSAAEQKQWAETDSRTIFAGLEPVKRAAREHSKRLKVGYLSSDFRDHAVAWLAVGLLENHDRDRFETFAYSTPPPGHPKSARASHARSIPSTHRA